jgi:hypothetical protein
MSDLDGLSGIYANSVRWNAAVEHYNLSFAKYNPQIGERELQPIEFGLDARQPRITLFRYPIAQKY